MTKIKPLDTQMKYGKIFIASSLLEHFKYVHMYVHNYAVVRITDTVWRKFLVVENFDKSGLGKV